MSAPFRVLMLRPSLDEVPLYTLTTRLPAIHLYQHFGFVPCLRHAADLAAWGAINGHVRVPFRANQVVDIR
jgi:hypothetical protein